MPQYVFQTYEEAQNKIDDDKDQESLTQGLRRLLKLSKIMKQKRVDAGALQLASSEVRYVPAVDYLILSVFGTI